MMNRCHGFCKVHKLRIVSEPVKSQCKFNFDYFDILLNLLNLLEKEGFVEKTLMTRVAS